MPDEDTPATKRSSLTVSLFAGVVGLAFAILVAVLVPLGAEYPPECPHDPIPSTTEAALKLVEFTGGQDNVPEFNDCQKFLVGDRADPEFDSLYAIFASWRLNGMFGASGVELLEDFATKPADSIYIVPSSGTPVPGTEEMVGLISAWGDYDPLGIVRGYNCLLLRFVGGTTWEAEMIPTGDVPNCVFADQDQTPGRVFRRSRPDAASKELAVHRVEAPNVPPVARWGFDVTSWKHYIVIKCGNATCLIGEADQGAFDPGEFVTGPLVESLKALGMQTAGNPQLTGPAFTVPGWYDAQVLARRPPLWETLLWRLFRHFGMSQPKLRPTSPLVWAAAVPAPNLAATTEAQFEADWVHVASVALAAHSDEYQDKANLSMTRNGTLNRIEARKLAPSQCPGSAGCDCPAEADGERWVSRHTNAVTGEPAHYCMTRYDLGEDVAQVHPGTVRWRWLAEDETLWFKCPGGCCTPED